MTYSVTIAAGKKDVVLPNGNRYQAGAVVALSDDEYSELTPGALKTLISATSYLGAAVTRTIFIAASAKNVVLPNLQRYNGGAMVVLSDAQYSTIDAAAKAAWFASDTAGGTSVPAGFGTSASFARLLPMLNTAVLAATTAFAAPAVNRTVAPSLAASVAFSAPAFRADQLFALPAWLAAGVSFPAPSVQHNA